MPGITAVLLAEDVPGLNDVGAVRHDEILLADKEVFLSRPDRRAGRRRNAGSLSRGGGKGDGRIRTVAADFHD